MRKLIIISIILCLSWVKANCHFEKIISVKNTNESFLLCHPQSILILDLLVMYIHERDTQILTNHDYEFDNNTFVVTDIDGNQYETVQIGDNIWMQENLKTSRYRNGDPIQETTLHLNWATTTGAWCWFDNNPTHDEIYGKLYNWYAVDDNRGICPEGWHVPLDIEWEQLTYHIGGLSTAGKHMKESSFNYWQDPNIPDQFPDNRSGFTGLPGGKRQILGSFSNLHFDGYWWSSTEWSNTKAVIRRLYFDSISAFRSFENKQRGYSVRCIMD